MSPPKINRYNALDLGFQRRNPDYPPPTQVSMESTSMDPPRTRPERRPMAEQKCLIWPIPKTQMAPGWHIDGRLPRSGPCGATSIQVSICLNPTPRLILD
jgi:hypothetical protein